MELLYAKYNRHRLPPFQIETSIWRDRDRKVVLKKALGPDAVPHLQRMYEQAAPIRSRLRSDRLRLPEVAVIDEQTLRFDFVEGRSLDALLVGAFLEQDQARYLGIIAGYVELLQNAFTPLRQEAARGAAPLRQEATRGAVPLRQEAAALLRQEATQGEIAAAAISQVFGLTAPAELDGLGPFLTPALVDLVFENILVDGDRHYLIDHEWVFDGCLPVSFVLFRSLFYFYEKHKACGLEAWMSLSSVLERFDLSPETVGRYREMDEAFQAYVFGRERCYRYKDRYAKFAHTVPSMLETIELQGKVVRDYYAEIEKMQQMLRNSVGWQFIQKTGRRIDKHFPPGTRRRRVLERMLRRI